MNFKSMVFISFFLIPLKVFPQGFTTPIDVTVDTGSHTCTSPGQEKKVYKEIYAGDNRYFINESLSETSRFGSGGCEYSPDGGNSYEKRK